MGMNLIAITFLAFLNERVVEYFFGKIKVLKPALLYVSALTGIALAFAYQASIFSALDLGIVSAYLWVDFLVTGIVIGGGSNYLNTIVEFVKNSGKAKEAEAKAIKAGIEAGYPIPLG